jgi:hypothetical protein
MEHRHVGNRARSRVTHRTAWWICSLKFAGIAIRAPKLMSECQDESTKAHDTEESRLADRTSSRKTRDDIGRAHAKSRDRLVGNSQKKTPCMSCYTIGHYWEYLNQAISHTPSFRKNRIRSSAHHQRSSSVSHGVHEGARGKIKTAPSRSHTRMYCSHALAAIGKSQNAMTAHAIVASTSRCNFSAIDIIIIIIVVVYSHYCIMAREP